MSTAPCHRIWWMPKMSMIVGARPDHQLGRKLRKPNSRHTWARRMYNALLTTANVRQSTIFGRPRTRNKTT
jgi:hypothetical protein